MSLLNNDDLKEQQRINELERKIRLEKAKRDKKLTHQKIILGAFFLDILENDAVHGLKKFTADNLDNFLIRKTDKEDFKTLIDTLRADIQTHNNDVQSNNHY